MSTQQQEDVPAGGTSTVPNIGKTAVPAFIITHGIWCGDWCPFGRRARCSRDGYPVDLKRDTTAARKLRSDACLAEVPSEKETP